MSDEHRASRTDVLRLAPTAGSPAVDSLVEQARLAEARGQRDTARDLYQRALDSLDPQASADLVATLNLGIGRTHFDAENYISALESVEAALGDHRIGDATTAAALDLRGRIHWGQGQIAKAVEDFSESRQRARLAGALGLAASGNANLGALALIRGEISAAVVLLETALAEYRQLADDATIALVLSQLAPLYADLKRWNAAEQAFAEALRLSASHSDNRALARLELARAEMAINRQNFERAGASATRALELAKRLDGAQGLLAHGHLLTGIVARELGNLVLAERLLEQAERMATDAGDLLLCAETARERADLLGRQDRHQQTLLSLNKAYRLLSQVRGRRTDLQVARRLNRLEEDFIDVVRRWAQRIESKDHSTAGHCERVSEWTSALAERMGIDSSTLFWYRVGALLHDIGKLAIPSGVLNKAGRLTSDEWALVKRHPSLGAEMLADVDFPWEVRPIVESHHECWDGSGYPHGLAGNRIPLAARIFAVADVFDALITRRSFKQALSPDDAVEVMRKDVGRQFDPAVFRIFEELVLERGSGAGLAESQRSTDHASGVDDSLTAVPDRRTFFALAQQALADRRGSARPVALLTVDVDHFRLINDAYGRLQGDDLLWALAKVLQRGVRAGDTVGRRGDDEFLILLPDASPAMSLEVAGRLRAAAEAMRCTRRDASDETIALTISIGVANAPADGETIEALAAAADRALFRAKRDGRNAVVTEDRDVTAVTATRLALDHFVGREEPLRELVTVLDASTRGEPQFAAVVGEAGIGKSALIRQLEPEVRLRGASIVTGQCADTELKTPLAPWLAIVAHLHARRAVPFRDWPLLSQLVPELRLPGGAVHPTATPAQVQEEIVHYVRLATLSHPLVIVIEDAHWADSASWDVIEGLANGADRERLLVCLTMRADEARAVADRRRRLAQLRPVRQISLGRLTVDDIRRWVQAAFHDGALGDEFPSFVFDYTEGIPLYVIQVLRILYDEGGIWYGGTRWEWRAVNELSLPSAIGEVLERRLDRLSPGARSVLASAAVLGPAFDIELLLAAAAASETQVRAAIDEGIGASVLVAADGARPGRYGFVHALLADACRRAIPERQRQRVHSVAARMLELRSPTAVSEIAAHYHAAGNDEQAYRYAVLASDRAASVFAHDEAIACLTIAQRHAPSPAELAGTRAQLAALGETAGRFDYAEEMCDLALDWLDQQGGSAQTVAVRRLRESVRLRRGRPPNRVIDELQLLLSLADSNEDQRERVTLTLALASAHLALADWALAERMSRRAVELAGAQHDLRLKGEASLQLGQARSIHAPAEALVFLRDAEHLFGSVGDVMGESLAANARSGTLARLGRLADANQAASDASELARSAHSASASAAAALGMADVAFRRGEFDLAAEWLNDGGRLYAALRDEPGRATVSLARAHLSFEQENIEDAREIFRSVAARAVDLGLPWMELAAHAGSVLSLPRGRPPEHDGRWGRINELLSTTRPDWWFPGRERVDVLAIRVALAAGHTSVAAGLFDHAFELAESRDVWASCWLVAQVGEALVTAGIPSARSTLSFAARRAAEFSFAPLAQRLALQLASRVPSLA